jgi:ABC-type phosphate/phosphonate transport system substrate-binding protein
MGEMKRLLAILGFALLGCSVPSRLVQLPGPQTTRTPTPSAPATPRASSEPLGTGANPLVLALPPSTEQSADVLQAGRTLAGLLQKATGFKIVTVIPPSETELVRAFGIGNAHIASLSPFGYLRASEDRRAEAAFGREQEGAVFYGAQFIAPPAAGFTAYFDPTQAKNLVEAAVALAQFRNRKPCWTDALSPSGYVVPLGYLAEAGVPVREPAFLAGHPAVVRALYAGGICDFGATYVDARTYPALEDELPDVKNKIAVVWRVPPIIPYETLVFAHEMPVDVRRALTRAFVDLMADPEGRSAMQTLYGIGAMQVVQDAQYDEFRKAVRAAGLDWNALIK